MFAVRLLEVWEVWAAGCRITKNYRAFDSHGWSAIIIVLTLNHHGCAQVVVVSLYDTLYTLLLLFTGTQREIISPRVRHHTEYVKINKFHKHRLTESECPRFLSFSTLSLRTHTHTQYTLVFCEDTFHGTSPKPWPSQLKSPKKKRICPHKHGKTHTQTHAHYTSSLLEGFPADSCWQCHRDNQGRRCHNLDSCVQLPHGVTQAHTHV